MTKPYINVQTHYPSLSPFPKLHNLPGLGEIDQQHGAGMVEIKRLGDWQLVSQKAVVGLAVVLSGMMPSGRWETIAAAFPAQGFAAAAPVLAAAGDLN